MKIAVVTNADMKIAVVTNADIMKIAVVTNADMKIAVVANADTRKIIPQRGAATKTTASVVANAGMKMDAMNAMDVMANVDMRRKMTVVVAAQDVTITSVAITVLRSIPLIPTVVPLVKKSFVLTVVLSRSVSKFLNYRIRKVT